MKDTTIKLLQREDKDFQSEHFDFDFLKGEGLKYIGELSGKIWTDHNAHDPGITILEMLGYALMDLGYRTQLPIQDIVAAPRGEDNQSYFSPAEILANNPTTIMDYRKLLIEIDGVQNVWLEPNFDHQYGLPFNSERNEDCSKIRISCPANSDDRFQFTLNGLYTVCIQKEAQIEGKEIDALRERVLDTLHAHRNLCEDFETIKILCEEQLGFCAEVDIASNVSPEETYAEILIAVEQFLSPKINFYTLREMLEEKEKAIEDVFAGRPFDPEYNSPGFIDEEELENIPLRKEIHLSDLYGVVNAVDGVETVRNISMKGTTSAGLHDTANDTDCGTWVFHLAEDHVPVFSEAISCIKIKREGATFQLDSFEVQRYKNQLGFSGNTGKAQGKKAYLDIDIPKGRFRPDLGAYYSIQNEFPSIYGIGEGGLPDSASKKRKAQALQLKAYLLFFDQLLVNYLSRLSNVRHLFSFKDSSEKINQDIGLDSVPDLEDILQFYNTDAQSPIQLLPINKEDFFNTVRSGLEATNPFEFNFNGEKYSTNNKTSRDVQIEQLARELSQENYNIEVHPTENCYYFIIQPDSLSVVLLARAIFNEEEEARIAANNIGYVGAKKQNYQAVNKPSEQKYSFELLFAPSTDTSLVAELTETEQSNLDKRNLFLDHLLARFSESFTEYSLLVFDQFTDRKAAARHLTKVKSNFLCNYPDLSSNRGKAFDYHDQNLVWEYNNSSGLEKRFYGLTGLNAPENKYLCNFEVHKYGQEFQVLFKYKGKPIFQSQNTYDRFDKAAQVCNIILQEAKENKFYSKEDQKDCFRILFNSSIRLAPLNFKTKEERDFCIWAIRNLLHQNATEDNTNVYASRSVYHLELTNAAGISMARSIENYREEASAKAKVKSFLDSIKKQTPLGDSNLENLKLTTRKCDGNWVSIEKETVDARVKVTDSEYLWQILGIDGKAILTSTQHHLDQASAFKEYLKIAFEENKEWKTTSDGVQLKREGKLLAEHNTKSEAAATLIIQQADLLLNSKKIKQHYLKETGKAYGIELRDKSQKVILESVWLYQNKKLTENLKDSLSLDHHEFQAINDTQYKIIFKDTKGSLIAISRETTNDPNALLERISANWNALEIVDYESSYSFKILSSKGDEELLEGFARYETPVKAFAALFGFLDDYKRGKLSFWPIEETEIQLADIELFMADERGQFHAFSPKENFGKPEYWKNETKIITALLSNMAIPLDFASESKYYINTKKGEPLLESIPYFAKPITALNAGRKVLFQMALDNQDCNILTVKNHPFFGLGFEEQPPMLLFSVQGTKLELQEVLDAFKKELAQYRFQVVSKEIPSKWKHRFYWLNESGLANILYESKNEYSTWVDAANAYAKFLSVKSNLEFKLSDKKDQFSFQIDLDKDVLVHPAKYASKKERNRIITEVHDVINFFENTESSESCVIQTERSRDDESFVYRLFRKSAPMAFHPCQCYDLDNDASQITYQDQLDKLCDTQYEYPSFYEKGNSILCKLENLWHYVLKDKKTDRILFTSKEGFYDKHQATEAFNANFLKIIHLASDSEHYLKVVNSNGTESLCVGKSIETAQVTMDENIFYRKDEMASWFSGFPIRLKAKKIGEKCFEDEIIGYYFHLIGNKTDCEVDWLSSVCYNTAAEAQKAFTHFINLLDNKVNYRPHLNSFLHDWRWDHILDPLPPALSQKDDEIETVTTTRPKFDPCCHYISITEVLAESCQEYLNEDCAWGQDRIIATIPDLVFMSLEKACGVLEGTDFSIGENIIIRNKPSAKADQDLFFYVLPIRTSTKDERQYSLVGALTYDSVEAAQAAAKTDVAQGIPKNLLRIIYDDDCLYRIALINPIEAAPKLQLPCNEQVNTCIDQFKTAKGLERFLQAACHDTAFIPYVTPGKELSFSFKIVEPESYYVARHPYKFHTRDERDRMMHWLFVQLRGTSWTFEAVQKMNGDWILQLCLPVDKAVKETKEQIHYVRAPKEFNPFNMAWKIDVNGEGKKFCLLESAKCFSSLEKENGQLHSYKECLEKNLSTFLSKMDHWHPTGDFTEEDFGIALINPNKILALHPQKYDCEEDLGEAIQDTKTHIHTEGMHLLEHVLLRPEKQIWGENEKGHDCSCVLLAMPDSDCELPLPTEDIDPCLSSKSAGEVQIGSEDDLGKKDPVYIPGADPYSFVATAVLPYWSKRFKNENFKSYVSKTLLRETPAHIALNQLWLTPRQLCKFEDAYRLWWYYKAQLPTCQAEMPCDLIECLLALRNYCTPIEEQGEEACDCNSTTVSAGLINLTERYTNGRNYRSPYISSTLRNLAYSSEQDSGILNKRLAAVASNLVVGTKVVEVKLGMDKVLKKEANSAQPSLKTKTKKTSKKKVEETIPLYSQRPFYNNIEKITDQKVVGTKTYKNAFAFAKKINSKNLSPVLIKELSERVIGTNLRYALGRSGGGEDQAYLSILADTLALSLDKLVEQDKSKALYINALKDLMAKIKEKDVDLTALKKHWNTRQLKGKMKKAPAIDAYLKIFKL